MKPYITIPFSFSKEAWEVLNRILGPIVDDYQKNAPLMSALVRLKPDTLDSIKNSVVWAEVLKFSAQYDLPEPYPQLFIYKQLENKRRLILGNPHIDTTGTDGVVDNVPVRFNILVNGDENTEMVWWPIDRDGTGIAEISLTLSDGTETRRLQAVGSSLIEQWRLLGEPKHRCSTLAKKQEYASFVRTDILHALNWTGSAPRLVFSLRYPTEWEVIYDRLDQ